MQILFVLFKCRQPAGDGLALVIGLDVGDGLSFLLQDFQTGSQIQDHNGQHSAREQPQNCILLLIPPKHEREEQLRKAQCAPDERRPPDHRNAAQSPKDPRKNLVDQRVFKESWCFCPACNAQKERQRQSRSTECEKNIVPEIDIPDIAKKGCPREEQQSKQREKQIERNFIEPALVNAVHALLVPHGAQQEDKQEQADRKKQNGQHDQKIACADQPLDPCHDVQRGIARSKRAFEIRLIDHCDVAAVAQRSAHVLLVIGGSLAGIIVFIQCAGAEQNFTGVLVGELKIDVGGERVIAITEKIARDRIVLGPGVQRRPAVAVRLL